MDLLGARQQDAASAGDVLQRRADDRDLRRVRDSFGRLHVHHRGWCPDVYEAKPRNRPAVRMSIVMGRCRIALSSILLFATCLASGETMAFTVSMEHPNTHY